MKQGKKYDWVKLSSHEAGKFYLFALAAVGPCSIELDEAGRFYRFRESMYPGKFRIGSSGSYQNYRNWCKRYGKK